MRIRQQQRFRKAACSNTSKLLGLSLLPLPFMHHESLV